MVTLSKSLNSVRPEPVEGLQKDQGSAEFSKARNTLAYKLLEKQ